MQWLATAACVMRASTRWERRLSASTARQALTAKLPTRLPALCALPARIREPAGPRQQTPVCCVLGIKLGRILPHTRVLPMCPSALALQDILAPQLVRASRVQLPNSKTPSERTTAISAPPEHFTTPRRHLLAQPALPSAHLAGEASPFRTAHARQATRAFRDSTSQSAIPAVPAPLELTSRSRGRSNACSVKPVRAHAWFCFSSWVKQASAHAELDLFSSSSCCSLNWRQLKISQSETDGLTDWQAPTPTLEHQTVLCVRLPRTRRPSLQLASRAASAARPSPTRRQAASIRATVHASEVCSRG